MECDGGHRLSCLEQKQSEKERLKGEEEAHGGGIDLNLWMLKE